MLEPTKHQELEAALARLGANWLKWIEGLRSEVVSMLANNPNPEVEEALRLSLIKVETAKTEWDDTCLKFASVVASISNPEYREKYRQTMTRLVKTLNTIHDRALDKTKSRAGRYEWVRKVRSTCVEDASKLPFFDRHLATIENLLRPRVDGAAATLAFDLSVGESLPGEAGFPRLWEILAYLLPRDARQRIYEPARAELLEDYLLSRSCRRGSWSRLAVNGVFLVRTLLLAGECGRVLLASRAVQFWLWLMGLALAWIIRLTQLPPE